jgi:hypothetical protein
VWIGRVLVPDLGHEQPKIDPVGLDEGFGCRCVAPVRSRILDDRRFGWNLRP